MITDFQVNVTEILGTDSMNNSRVTINNNFKNLAKSISSIVNIISGNTIGVSGVKFIGDSVNVSGEVQANSLKLGDTPLDGQTLADLLQLAPHSQEILNLLQPLTIH